MSTTLPSRRKRSRDAVIETTCSHRRTRSRLTPPPADSSSTSEPSVSSDATALVPTSVPEDSTDATGAEYDSDTESDMSESSEDPSSDSDSDSDNRSNSNSDEAGSHVKNGDAGDGHARVNLRANRGKKPVMRLLDEDLGQDLRPWLKEFLPRLQAANEELEKERQTGTLKDKMIEKDDEEGQYIEMDLGLGVLEERDPNADEPSSSDSEEEEEEDTRAHAQSPKKEKDIIGKLMKRENKTVSIQEVDDIQRT